MTLARFFCGKTKITCLILLSHHQGLPIGGAWHVWALFQWFQGFTARAVCSAVGPQQCCAMGVHPTKVLSWCLGSASRVGVCSIKALQDNHPLHHNALD